MTHSRWSFRLSLLGALSLGASSLPAQVLGLPVVNNGAGTGISIGADVGFANDAAGGRTAIGANASVGLGLVGVRAMVSRVDIGGDAVWAKGAAATLRLFGGPLIPFRVMLLGGAAQWKVGGATVTHLPLSLGVAATIPNPAFAIKPWIAPRISLTRTKIGGDSNNDSNFAIAGGVDITLQNGITLRGAYDRVMRDGAKPGILAFGLIFAP